MRSLRLVLLACGTLLGSLVSEPLVAQAAIPVGTQVPVTNVNELSSKTAKRGDTLALVVQADVVISGQVVIPKGTAVHGAVAQADKAGRFGHAGKLRITVDSLRTVDGQTVSLVADLKDTTLKASAAGHSPQNKAAAQAASQVMGMVPDADLVAGAFHHGDDITYKAHILIPVFTVSYVVVTVPAGATSSAAQPAVPVAAPPASQAPAAGAGDSTAPIGIAAASIAFFDAAQTWDHALGAIAAHQSATPAVRDLGLRILREDSVLQAQGQALAAQFHTTIALLSAADHTKLNQVLLTLRNTQGTALDQALLQQLYDFENGFVSNIDTEDTTTPMGKLLNQVVPVWKERMARITQLLTAPDH